VFCRDVERAEYGRNKSNEILVLRVVETQNIAQSTNWVEARSSRAVVDEVTVAKAKVVHDELIFGVATGSHPRTQHHVMTHGLATQSRCPESTPPRQDVSLGIDGTCQFRLAFRREAVGNADGSSPDADRLAVQFHAPLLRFGQ
jgi:hypothetical protein